MLSRTLGKHIFENHLDDLFSESTPAGLKNRVNLTIFHTPLETNLKSLNDKWFWCLGCQSCLKRKEMTKKHQSDFECKTKHHEWVQQLKQQYPVKKEGEAKPTTGGVDEKTKKRLELFVLALYDRIHKYHAILHSHKEKIPWGSLEEKVFGLDAEIFDKAFDINDDFDFDIENLSTFLNFDEPTLRAKNKDRFLIEFYSKLREYKDTLEEKKPIKEEKSKSNPILQHLLDVMKDEHLPLKDRQLSIADGLKLHKLSDPVLEAFLKIDPPPPEKKQRPQFPPTYVTPPEPQKFPAIINTTKRSEVK